jgi:Starch-binding associating with outer membrane
MKKNKLYILGLFCCFLEFGCSKSTFDINDNPNNSIAATVDLVLPNALKVTGDRPINSYNAISMWMGYWCPSGSYAISATDLSTYKQTTDFANGLWFLYYDNLEDYEYIEKTAIAQSKPFYEATAKIMKAYAFQQLVDMFNNVPYSDALKGVSTGVQPKYDKAQDIYEDITTNLEKAVTLLARSDAKGDAASDALFGGVNSKWAQFANTLKLRILMRQTEMSGRSAYIQSKIDAIKANGAGFLTTNAAVNPGYSNAAAGKQNPFWSLNYNIAGTYINDFWRANQYPIAFSVANNDPRYKRLYAPASQTGLYQGNVIGSATNFAGNSASTFGPGLLISASQPSVILSASESYFLQAEAVVRGFLTDNAKSLFESGVTSSFNYLGAGSPTAYLAQAGNKKTNYAAATSTAEQIDIIIRQKWMAMNTVTPFEAWCDYRRLGLPADIPLTVSPFVDILKIPYRFLYPTSEYNTNNANVTAQGTIDHHTSKIFWMK